MRQRRRWRGAAPARAFAATLTASASAAPPPPPAAIAIPVDDRLVHVPAFARGAAVNWRGHDESFPFLTAWGECLTYSPLQPTGELETCEIRRFRLIERNPVSGTENATFARADFGRDEGRPVDDSRGALFRRYEPGRTAEESWYRSPDDGAGGRLIMTNSLVRRGVLAIEVSQTPERVAHWWTYVDTPAGRPRSASGRAYFVEIEFLTRGTAAVRVGLDRWTEAGESFCPTTGTRRSNCESFHGNWYSTSSSGFVTLRIPVD